MFIEENNHKAIVYYLSIIKEREIAFYKQKLESNHELMIKFPDKKIFTYRYKITFNRYNNLLKTVVELNKLKTVLEFY